MLLKTYELPNGGGKEQPYYALTRIECLYAVAKFNDEVSDMQQFARERWKQRQRSFKSIRLLEDEEKPEGDEMSNKEDRQ